MTPKVLLASVLCLTPTLAVWSTTTTPSAPAPAMPAPPPPPPPAPAAALAATDYEIIGASFDDAVPSQVMFLIQTNGTETFGTLEADDSVGVSSQVTLPANPGAGYPNPYTASLNPVLVDGHLKKWVLDGNKFAMVYYTFPANIPGFAARVALMKAETPTADLFSLRLKDSGTPLPAKTTKPTKVIMVDPCPPTANPDNPAGPGTLD